MSLTLAIAGCVALALLGCVILGRVSSRHPRGVFEHAGCLLWLLIFPGIWLGLPLAVANLTDMPGGFWNTVGVLVVTVPPAYLLVFFLSAGARPQPSRSSQAFAAYRPVTLDEAPPPPPRVPPSATLLGALGALLIFAGCIGVRWVGHLHAMPRVAALPSDFGPVRLKDTEDNVVGNFPSAQLRPGEAACGVSIVAAKPTLLLTVPGREEPYRLTVAATETDVPVSVVEVMEDAWVCSAYARAPLTFIADEATAADWKLRPPAQ